MKNETNQQMQPIQLKERVARYLGISQEDIKRVPGIMMVWCLVVPDDISKARRDEARLAMIDDMPGHLILWIATQAEVDEFLARERSPLRPPIATAATPTVHHFERGESYAITATLPDTSTKLARDNTMEALGVLVEQATESGARATAVLMVGDDPITVTKDHAPPQMQPMAASARQRHGATHRANAAALLSNTPLAGLSIPARRRIAAACTAVAEALDQPACPAVVWSFSVEMLGVISTVRLGSFAAPTTEVDEQRLVAGAEEVAAIVQQWTAKAVKKGGQS